MIDLYDGGFADIIAPNYKADPEVQALSYAIQSGVRLILDTVGKAHVYADIDSLQEDALDLLAAEMRTQYYDIAESIEAKRALVKNALKWHMSSGTTAAVIELIEKAIGDASIEEWYEYDGDPYHFRIAIDGEIPAGGVEYVGNVIKNIKNVRSVLDSISALRSIPCPAGAGAHLCRTVTRKYLVS